MQFSLNRTSCLPVQEPGPRKPPAAAQADPAQSTGPLENTDLLPETSTLAIKYYPKPAVVETIKSFAIFITTIELYHPNSNVNEIG